MANVNQAQPLFERTVQNVVNPMATPTVVLSRLAASFPLLMTQPAKAEFTHTHAEVQVKENGPYVASIGPSSSRENAVIATSNPHNPPAGGNSPQYKKGHNIGSNSQRVYFASIPIEATKESVYSDLTFMCYGVTNVKVYKRSTGTAFAFVDLRTQKGVTDILANPVKIGNQQVIAQLYKTWEERHSSGKFQVFCRGIPMNACFDDILPIFKRYGEVTEFVLPKDKFGGSHRGNAYVHFEDLESGWKLLAESYVIIAGERAQCLLNTKSDAVISKMNALRGSSKLGCYTAAAAGLPAVPDTLPN
ncbi:hypothetical protein BV898_04114 [Hypsibius exemplaris]|uniref:RRM domain-containing protein n=1 Tax=Hypsibius exemplaris TaxID=2072580 RepID=A0A1W0X397_HYPEX|nr:hypothetical protein BV898_04114 [Hypsibius exemplaris]